MRKAKLCSKDNVIWAPSCVDWNALSPRDVGSCTPSSQEPFAIDNSDAIGADYNMHKTAVDPLFFLVFLG